MTAGFPLQLNIETGRPATLPYSNISHPFGTRERSGVTCSRIESVPPDAYAAS
jgi:hypothetical protein